MRKTFTRFTGMALAALMVCSLAACGSSTTVGPDLSPSEGQNTSQTSTEKTGITGLKLSKSSVTLKVGGTEELSVMTTPADADQSTLVWTVTDPTIAQVENGKITLDDEVTISERAASMGGSQMYMEVGETHSLRELMEGVAMASANDGCVALAEYVAGSEEIFVERMNARAKELGMVDTHFVNTNGLPVADHYSSAYDIAVMSKKLYAFEETHRWFTTWQSTITVGLPGKEKEFRLTNTNKLIKAYPGCNGIKTGFTNDAGFCLSASATRDDTHLIAVALGCQTSKIRNAQVAKLFDYGFANYEAAVVAEKGDIVGEMRIAHGTPETVHLVAGEKMTALTAKGEKDTVTSEISLNENIPLPLKAGEKVGEMVVYKSGTEVGRYPVLAEKSVEKASFKDLAIRKITG